MLNLEENILINQWSQTIHPISVLIAWFESSSLDKQREILQNLVSLGRQARVAEEDWIRAISESSLNPRRSACVILSKGATVEALNKLSSLKNSDGKDAFVLLLHLFKIADERRKKKEDPEDCNHWWHRDLGNATVLENIRASYDRGEL